LPSRDAWEVYPIGGGAWYYGAFVNPRTLQLATFAEGDLVIITCESGLQFRQELHSMARFHGPRRAPMAVGYGEDGSVEAFFDGLTFFPVGALAIRFDIGEPAKDAAGRFVPPLIGYLNPALACLRMRAGESLALSPEAFHLDLLDVREYEGYQATATRTAAGYEVALRIGSRTYSGAVTTMEGSIA